jgi:hypothetical protein
MLTAAVIASITAGVNVVVPHRTRLIGVAVLVVPQLYMGVRVELATVAVVWTLTTCVLGWTRNRPLAATPLVTVMGLFVAVTAVSLLWSTNTNSGFAAVVRGAVFLLWLREVIVTARENPQLVDTIVMWLTPGVAAQAVLAIVFRTHPDLEYRFLRSGLAKYLVGPQADTVYSDISNNVYYAFKSGGVFVNGNMASLFGGVAALVLVVCARRTHHRWLYAVAALSLTGAFYTGSKTVIVVGVGVGLAVWLLPHMLNSRAVFLTIPAVFLVPLTANMILEFLARTAPGFYSASERSFDNREPMWRGAAQLFVEHPFLGLGFGGWSEQMVRFTNRPDIPPHNLVITAWANSGITAAALAVVFMAAVVAVGVKTAKTQPPIYERRTAVIALCAVAWVFAHGMADNTTLYGEQRTMIVFALAVGYVYVMRTEMSAVRPSHQAARSQTPGWRSVPTGR